MDSPKTTPRRQYFTEEDDGFASMADIEAGKSGNHHLPFVSGPLQFNHSLQRKNNLTDISSGPFLGFPRSTRTAMRFYEAGRFYVESHQPHFLDSCCLCNKPLAQNRDIFMYRGDTPFCSEECREEQIEMDESKEKSLNLSASKRSLRKAEQIKSSPSNKTLNDCTSRTGTVVAA